MNLHLIVHPNSITWKVTYISTAAECRIAAHDRMPDNQTGNDDSVPANATNSSAAP
eukprot:m.408759 g.408759  ORF g.408759 m.408759 type:complete len:56 (-) comp21237_c0_seq30:1221-1388(-)